jgi:hypothetical protein
VADLLFTVFLMKVSLSGYVTMAISSGLIRRAFIMPILQLAKHVLSIMEPHKSSDADNNGRIPSVEHMRDEFFPLA